MRRPTTALLAAGLLAATVAAGPAESRAEATHELELELGDDASVAGGVPAGINPGYFGLVPTGEPATCNSDPLTYCETVLVKLANPYDEENANKGRERANLDAVLTPTNPASDFDLIVYESDEDGTQGAEIGRSGLTPIADGEQSQEVINAVITTTEDVEEVWVLYHVVYFAAASDYALDLSFTQ